MSTNSEILQAKKSGIDFLHNGYLFHADFHIDGRTKSVQIKGMSPEAYAPNVNDGDPYFFGANMKIEDGKIIPTPEFKKFIDANAVFKGWEKWNWCILDAYGRFKNIMYTPSHHKKKGLLSLFQ